MKKILLLLFFLCIFVLFLRSVSGDGDFFHHVNTGRYVMENRRFPYVDEWTFTATGKPWVAYAWGAGIIFYLIYSTFGSQGIAIFVGLLGTITFWLLYLHLRTYRLSHRTIFLVLTLSALIVATRFPNRPEIFTYPFVVSFLLINRKGTYIWLLPILTLLWTNLYGASVFVGLGLLLFFALKRKPSLPYYLTILLSFSLAFVNPYGFRALFYIFSIPAIAQIQGEWHGIMKNLLEGPLDYLIVVQYKIFLYFLYLGFFIFLCILRQKLFKKYQPEALLSLLLISPLITLRQMPLAILLSTPYLALLMENQKKIVLYIAIAVCTISLPIVLWVAPPGLTEHPDDFPQGVIAYVKERKLTGTAFTNQQVGAFLTYHLYPQIRVYADTRDDLFLGTRALSDFYNTFMARSSVLDLLETYHADIVIGDLADGASYQPLFYDNRWTVVYMSGHYFIAVKNQNQSPTPIDPYSFSGAKSEKEPEALNQYTQFFAKDPTNLNNQLRLATLLVTLRRFNEAETLAKKIEIPHTPKGPIFASIRDYLLVQASFAKGNCGNTRRYLKETEKVTRRKFLFTPWRNIPSPVNKGYAFFYLVCQKNLPKAQKYLNAYLLEPDIDEEEKEKTKELFEKTMKGISL